MALKVSAKSQGRGPKTGVQGDHIHHEVFRLEKSHEIGIMQERVKMRLPPIVMAATAAGLIGVSELPYKRGSSRSRWTALGHGDEWFTDVLRLNRLSPPPPTSGSNPPAAVNNADEVPSTTPTTASTTRTATGPLVNYNYGVLSVSVTVAGGRITKVGIASLDDGGNFRSQSIDQESIPTLEQQAMQAQSANIQGVSGASYTSAGFEQSLQAALSQLGIS